MACQIRPDQTLLLQQRNFSLSQYAYVFFGNPADMEFPGLRYNSQFYQGLNAHPSTGIGFDEVRDWQTYINQGAIAAQPPAQISPDLSILLAAYANGQYSYRNWTIVQILESPDSLTDDEDEIGDEADDPLIVSFSTIAGSQTDLPVIYCALIDDQYCANQHGRDPAQILAQQYVPAMFLYCMSDVVEPDVVQCIMAHKQTINQVNRRRAKNCLNDGDCSQYSSNPSSCVLQEDCMYCRPTKECISYNAGPRDPEHTRGLLINYCNYKACSEMEHEECGENTTRCLWNSSGQSCIDIPIPCNFYKTNRGCDTQSTRCNWDAGGSACLDKPCRVLELGECVKPENQNRCEWDSDYHGLVGSCVNKSSPPPPPPPSTGCPAIDGLDVRTSLSNLLALGKNVKTACNLDGDSLTCESNDCQEQIKNVENCFCKMHNVSNLLMNENIVGPDLAYSRESDIFLDEGTETGTPGPPYYLAGLERKCDITPKYTNCTKCIHDPLCPAGELSISEINIGNMARWWIKTEATQPSAGSQGNSCCRVPCTHPKMQSQSACEGDIIDQHRCQWTEGSCRERAN